MFMTANKGNAEQGKASAEFHIGFGIACKLRPWSALQVKKETWGWLMVWSHGTQLCSIWIQGDFSWREMGNTSNLEGVS